MCNCARRKAEAAANLARVSLLLRERGLKVNRQEILTTGTNLNAELGRSPTIEEVAKAEEERQS